MSAGVPVPPANDRSDLPPADPAALDERRRNEIVGPAGEAFARVVTVMARLRAPGGCPWDREQTHRSLSRYLLEETYETLEAIDSSDLDALRDELGDLVLQVLFHANIAWEEGSFTIADVCDHLAAKLVRRHPHVFGSVSVSGARDVVERWELQKRTERGTDVMDGIPGALPALARAAKLSGRAAGVGFELPDPRAAADKLRGELDEALAADDPAALDREAGDVLFAAAVFARKVGVEPEDALRRANQRFESRFRQIERRVADAGRVLESLSADEWREYWEQTKR